MSTEGSVYSSLVKTCLFLLSIQAQKCSIPSSTETGHRCTGVRLYFPSLQNGGWAVPLCSSWCGETGAPLLGIWVRYPSSLGMAWVRLAAPLMGVSCEIRQKDLLQSGQVASVASLLSPRPVTLSQKEMIVLWLSSTPGAFQGDCKLIVLWFIHNSHKFPLETWDSSIGLLF